MEGTTTTVVGTGEKETNGKDGGETEKGRIAAWRREDVAALELIRRVRDIWK